MVNGGDDMDAEEIISDIVKKTGIKVVKNEPTRPGGEDIV